MKPEDSFNRHMDRSGQIVVTPHVLQFVREHGFELPIVEA